MDTFVSKVKTLIGITTKEETFDDIVAPLKNTLTKLQMRAENLIVRSAAEQEAAEAALLRKDKALAEHAKAVATFKRIGDIVGE